MVSLHSLTKEGSRSPYAAIFAKQRVDGLATLVHRSIQVAKAAPNRNRGLIDPPRRVDSSRILRPPPLEFRNLLLDPAVNGRVRHDNASFGQHFDKISIAQAVREVPPHA